MLYRIMYIYYNPNPLGKQVGDCSIRAITKFLSMTWDEAYDSLCREGKRMADMPAGNAVWASLLKKNGCISAPIINTCPACYTIADFCADNPYGEFLLATGNHVVAVCDGNYYDSWDSGNEVPLFVWLKKGETYANLQQ